MRKLHGFGEVEHDIFIGPDGVELYLPWNFRHLICSRCARPTVSADISESMAKAIRRYTEPGYIRWLGGKFKDRPVCVNCREGNR